MVLSQIMAKGLGLVSRKTAVKLSVNTGKQIYSKCSELGRALTNEELEALFSQTLPKRCVPKVLKSVEETIPCLKRSGYSNEQINECLNTLRNSNWYGCAVANGAKKRPIMLNEEIPDIVNYSSFAAHELEHAIECNNSIRGIVDRYLATVSTKIKKLLSNKFMTKQAEDESLNVQFQTRIKTDPTAALNISSLKNNLLNFDSVNFQNLPQATEETIREFVNPFGKQSQNRRRYKLFKKILNMEIPAYTAGGEVERFILKPGENQHTMQETTVKIYKSARTSLKKDRKLFRKNLISGKLGKPEVFQSKKDIYNLFTTKEEKAILDEILKLPKNDEYFERILFYTLKRNPESLTNIKQFMEASNLSKEALSAHLERLISLPVDKMNNANIIKIAKILENGSPVYDLNSFGGCTAERLKEIAEYAGVKTPDGNFKYKVLFSYYNDAPCFNRLKELADISVNGKNPYNYCDIFERVLCKTDGEISQIIQKAKDAAKSGNIIEIV